MKEYQDIHDDEIRIIGHTSEKAKLHFNKTTITLAVACVVLAEFNLQMQQNSD